NPFNFQFTLQQGKAAEEGASLAVLYFQNIPDPGDKDHTGDMLTDLLTTALSQDKRLQVVSRERLYDILKEMGQSQTTTITPALAQRVAERAGVSMMLLGSILQTKPSLSVTARVVNVRTGNIVASQRLSGFSSTGFFGLVDTLATIVRGDVVPGESPAGAGETRSVAEVTTNSQEAYRLYSEGLDLSLKFLAGEAKAALGRAVELDSTFAMAYFELGAAEINEDNISRKSSLQKAWDLRERTTEKERLRIEAEYLDAVQGRTEESARILEHFIEKFPYELPAYDELAQIYSKLGEYDKAIQVEERSVRKDSLRPIGYNLLAYSYAGFNRKAEAIRTINRYIELMPWEANPYDSKGEIFMTFGEVDSAIAYYRQALAIRPDFNSAEKMGLKMMLDGRYAEAQRYFEQFGASLDPVQKAAARIDEINIQTHQGKLSQAQQLLLHLLPELRREKLDGQVVTALKTLAILARETGDNAAMLNYAGQLVAAMKGSQSETPGGRDLLAEALLRNGDAAGSERVLAQLATDMKGIPWFLQKRYNYGLAEIAAGKGEYGQAVELFQRALASPNTKRAPQVRYGIALLKNGHLNEAFAELQGATWWIPISFPPIELIFLPSGVEWPIDVVTTHYWLGVAYEQQGKQAEAKREFQKFLETWRDADFQSSEIKDARIRLARLGGPPTP
ncbi:MAG TPA: tetratricopeptide repeat protein, partial [Bacteroidota bacterium]